MSRYAEKGWKIPDSMLRQNLNSDLETQDVVKCGQICVGYDSNTAQCSSCPSTPSCPCGPQKSNKNHQSAHHPPSHPHKPETATPPNTNSMFM